MCTFLKSLSPRIFLGFLLLTSLGILGAAFILEHFYGVHPCQMCLYEQKVFMTTSGVAFLGLFFSSRWQYFIILLLGFIFIGGAGLAAYHVAIQQHWVSLPTFCAAQDFSAFDSIETLREQMLKTPFVRCDKVTWSLFGLSLAVYNTLVSLILALLCWKWACKQR